MPETDLTVINDLDAIRRREQAATEGPWETDAELVKVSGESRYVCDVFGLADKWPTAEFIAHARADVPAMADEIEQLRAALAAVERYADQLRADARTEPNDALAVGLLRAADGLGDLFAGAVTE